MQTGDRTIKLIEEPSSAPPDFLWENVAEIRQYGVEGGFTGAFHGAFYRSAQGNLPLIPEDVPVFCWSEVIKNSQKTVEAVSNDEPWTQFYHIAAQREAYLMPEVASPMFLSGDYTPVLSEVNPFLFFSGSSNFAAKYAIRSVFGGSGYQTTVTGVDTGIVKSGFTAQGWDIAQQYVELEGALENLVNLEEDDDWRIERSVYDAATYYAAQLRSGSIPAPQIFTHGRKSVVFNWSDGYTHLDLTISTNAVSALLSSPGRIIRRVERSKNQLVGPIALLLFGDERAAAPNSYSEE